MTRANTVMTTILLGSLFATGSPGAESESEMGPRKPEIFVGAGAVVSSKPYDGLSYKVYPVPLFGYEGERLYLRGIMGGYRLFKAENWSIGPTVRPRFEGYDAGDSSALSGMKDRNATIDGGIDLAWTTKRAFVSLVVLTDLLGAHDGHEVEISGAGMFPYGPYQIIPSLGLRWRSNALVRYYYGVKPEEARADRLAYKPDQTLTPVARLAIRRRLSEKWGFLFATQFEWLDDEISDSPIVDDNSTLSIIVGATYSF
jgi:outer membrane protein